ncbi:YiiD C-terminal domain-containing protein [Bdellovibrio sp. NC01]|uniref:YiiD C-terminal domain-containing protein n=1 Tax=Bdellovibrio sp. NC01 TaxID=2220073 RepID=UPI0011578DAE|nr:YiiD C-terminal domain-containing protein [Bdellovibrio sp. NC01]QDK38224.1 hypothetical protein DOE51_11840 [Bdellovibrio sp. NC01]
MEVKGQELEAILRDKIKLYEHLGIEVVEITSSKVHFRVSLEKNLNHKGTAFGGSLYATGVMSAYALVLAGLKHYHINTDNIVIAKGEISYYRPVDTDFDVVARFKNLQQEEAFFSELKQKNRVKDVVEVQILGDGGSLKASLSGTFVVNA